MSMAPCALLRHTSPGSSDALGSLLSSMEHFQRTYLFISIGTGKGQTLSTGKTTPCAATSN